MLPSLSLPPLEYCFGTSPIQAREVAPRSEDLRISDARSQSRCQQRTDARNVMKALARFVGPVPVHDHAIERQNLLFEAEQLTAERGKTCARNRRHPFIVAVSNDMEQLLDPLAPDRRDNAKLRKVSSDRIDY